MTIIVLSEKEGQSYINGSPVNDLEMLEAMTEVAFAAILEKNVNYVTHSWSAVFDTATPQETPNFQEAFSPV